MAIKTYNRTNFHRHTFCVFQEADLFAIENKKPDYKSKSGSNYYFTETGVYRLSNHWGRAANCKWRLASSTASTTRIKLGFAMWTAFHTDNDTQKLYFITVDFETQSVQYQHKDSAGFEEKFTLRTVAETTKIIKEIRNLYANDGWAKHFDLPLETLRKMIVEKLIMTDEQLINIKRKLLNPL